MFLKTEDINWIKADDKYISLYCKNACHYLLRQSLSSIKAQLDPQLFVRVHRSVIVNVERIKELQPTFGGDYNIVLEDNTKVPLSRNLKDDLFRLLGNPL